MAEALDVLKSIDASLKQLVRLMTVNAPKPVADDRDLDGKYGDPTLRFLPRDWTGGDFKGYRFSECPAELLEMVAETLDYFATKSEEKNELTDKGKPVAPFKRADAARARGWARRRRNGQGGTGLGPAGAGQASATPAEPEGWADQGGFERPDEDVPF